MVGTIKEAKVVLIILGIDVERASELVAFLTTRKLARVTLRTVREREKDEG